MANKNAQAAGLKVLLGDYPNTRPLKSGAARMPGLDLQFADVKLPHSAFKRVVRDLEFDIAELAIVTYLQAKAYGKPLVLVPAVVMGQMPHPCMVFNAERGRIAPSDLAGLRVGVRAYSVTTVTWVRGILANDYGVDLDRVRWITFEDPHVAEYRDPPTTTRAPVGMKIVDMLLAGELDAAIVSPRDLTDSRLQSVIPDAKAAAKAWCERYGVMPINHMVVATEKIIGTHRHDVERFYQLLLESKRAAIEQGAGGLEMVRFGAETLRPSLQIIIDYCMQQRLLPRALTVDELFNDVTRAFGT